MTLIERLREMRKEPWIYWYLARTCHTEGRGVMGWDETDEMNEQSILRRVAGAVEEATEQLRAENAELKRDEARLNWLESNPRHAQTIIDGQITDCVFYGISCAALMKLRDAIDAAMKGQT